MDPAKKMRVLVVDGLPLARFALSSLLDLHPLVTVCGEARDVPDARQQCEELKPHFVVTDLNLPRGDGV
ncbi:MAG TPA: response regulator, partial [Chthoniobacteraceae bacterium]